MDGNSFTLLCREHSEPINSQSWRLQAVRTGHAKLRPLTGIEVFETARTLVIEAHVLLQALEQDGTTMNGGPVWSDVVARVTADAVNGEIFDPELARDITRSLEHPPLEGGP